MVRRVDLNDSNGHLSNGIPAAVAIGEALHSSGTEVMLASAVVYEVGDLGFGEAIGPALAAGKLMKLDEDRLANAMSIALTAHVALNKGVGIMSMWKGIRSAEATKCGVWSAILASEGMTGPPQPFEGRGGWFSENGRRNVSLPSQEKLAIERKPLKNSVGVTSSQQMMRLVPEIRAWTKPDEIEWMQCETAEFGESTDAPKWDPVNQDTADHSRPYMLAHGLIYGDIWLDSFTPEKLRDPQIRALMNRMTFGQNPGWSNSAFHVTIRKKNGEQRGFDTIGGRRVEAPTDSINLSDEELVAKFNRICDFKKVDRAQRDQIRAIWGNLRQVKDIGEAIRPLAKFGQPKPL
jgi:2-methylcitrate dehydratase